MPGVERSKRFCRQRKKSPRLFDKKSFRWITLSEKKDLHAIIGCPKGKYDRKRKKCRVSTEIQSILRGHKGKRCPKRIRI